MHTSTRMTLAAVSVGALVLLAGSAVSAAPAELTGRVTGADLPIAGATVWAVPTNGSPAVAAETTESGGYAIPDAPDTQFAIWVEPGNSTGYPRQFKGGARKLSDARTWSVADEPLMLDVQLARGAEVTGRILTRSGEAPKPDYRVKLWSRDWSAGGDWTVVRKADSNEDGRFHLDTLPEGRALLSIGDSSSEPNQWYDAVPARFAATELKLEHADEPQKVGGIPLVKRDDAPWPYYPSNSSIASGPAKVGKEMQVDVGGDWPDGTVFKYRWLLGGENIPDATGRTYTPTPEQLDGSLQVRITTAHFLYASGSMLVPAKTVQLGEISPAPTPTIAGTPKPGETVKASVDDWMTGSHLSYQWRLNGDKLDGETGKKLAVKKSMSDKKLTVKVTGIADGYETRSKVSDSVKVK